MQTEEAVFQVENGFKTLSSASIVSDPL